MIFYIIWFIFLVDIDIEGIILKKALFIQHTLERKTVCVLSGRCKDPLHIPGCIHQIFMSHKPLRTLKCIPSIILCLFLIVLTNINLVLALLGRPTLQATYHVMTSIYRTAGSNRSYLQH